MLSRRAAVFLILALALARAASPASAVTLTRGPYLQLLSTRSVTVVWNTNVAASCSLAIGLLGSPKAVVTGGTGTVCAIRVDGLTAGGSYAYQPRANGVVLRSDSIFQTDDPTAPYVFLVVGDTGSADPSQLTVRDAMLASPAEFVLHTGDMIYEDGAAADFNPKFFVPYRDLIRRLVLWPSLGNHDVRTADGQPWRDAFWTPANNAAHKEDYYSFDYGNAHVVVLDSNESTTPGGGQYTFLDADLAASNALWKFVVFHHPPYSSGIHGSNSTLRANLGPVFDTYHVDIVFNGHDHDYERTKPLRAGRPVAPATGTVYVVTGGGGAELRPVGSSTFTAYAETVNHFVRVAVDRGSLLLHMTRADGTIGDTLSIVKSTTTTTTTRSTTTTLFAGPSSLINAGFEQGQTGWSGWTDAQNGSETTVTTAIACAGGASLNMKDSSTRTRFVFQEVTVQPGVPLRLQLLAKAQNLGSNQARAILEWRNGTTVLGSTTLTLPPGSYGCTPFALDGTPPANTNRVRVRLTLGPVTNGVPANDAHVWYDNVSLTTLPTSLLRNGSFELGQTGWSGWTDTQNAGEATVTTATGCAGGASLDMRDSSTKTRSVFQDVLVQPGVRLRLQLLARGKNLGSNQARPMLEWRNGTTVLSTTVLTLRSGTWGCTPFTLDATAPANTNRVRVRLTLGPATNGVPFNAAELWYDDVTLRLTP